MLNDNWFVISGLAVIIAQWGYVMATLNGVEKRVNRIERKLDNEVA